MSAFEQPLAQRLRPGKRAFFVTKQLAFQQRFRQGGTVDFDKRAVGAFAVVVNGAGDQLFSCATFTAYQDICL